MTIEVEVLRPACPNVQHKTFLLSPRVKSLLLFSCFHHIWNIQYSDHNTDHCTVRIKGTGGQKTKHCFKANNIVRDLSNMINDIQMIRSNVVYDV